jgi:predicted HicB family RNase H-like nuclease
MKRNPGRPKKAKKLSEYLEVRVEAAEKQTFKDAADLAGIPVSTWVRERLRRAAIRELEEASRPIAFLK